MTGTVVESVQVSTPAPAAPATVVDVAAVRADVAALAATAKVPTGNVAKVVYGGIAGAASAIEAAPHVVAWAATAAHWL